MISRFNLVQVVLAAALAGIVYFSAQGQFGDAKPEPVASKQDLNPWLIAQTRNYPADGSLKYLLPKENPTASGCTKDIYYQGKLIAKGDPQRRSHCIGIIWEIYFNACESYAKEKFGTRDYRLCNGISANAIKSFQKDFYGNSSLKTLVDALSDRGLGVEITDWSQAKPGDLMQFWSFNGSGHSALFLGWEYNSKHERTGVKYWSSQIATGPCVATGWIGNHENQIDRERLWIVRAYAPVQRK